MIFSDTEKKDALDRRLFLDTSCVLRHRQTIKATLPPENIMACGVNRPSFMVDAWGIPETLYPYRDGIRVELI
jgi:hypothetical protein